MKYVNRMLIGNVEQKLATYFAVCTKSNDIPAGIRTCNL